MSDAHTSNNWMNTSFGINGTSQPAYSQSWYIKTTNDYYGTNFRVKADCKITHAACGMEYKTGTGGTYKFQLWPMSSTIATPDMSGTVLAETATFTAGDTYDVDEYAFTSQPDFTAGQMVACLLIPVSVDASNYTNWWFQGFDFGQSTTMCLPGILVSTDAGSSWSATSSFKYWYPGIGLRTDKNFFLGGYPHSGAASFAGWGYDDRNANKITLPADDDIELHVSGIRVMGLWALAANEEIIIGCWDADGAEVDNSERTFDGAWVSSTSAAATVCHFLFANTVKMVSGGTYYVGLKQTGSGSVQPYRMRMGRDDSNAMEYLPGGSDFAVAQLWDASDSTPAWKAPQTGYSEGRALFDLMISDMHGGGASVVNTGLGKGDAGMEKCPSRVKQIRKPGYAVNANKVLKRNNGSYGWDPYG